MNTRIIELAGKRIAVINYEQSKYISVHTGNELSIISFNCDIRGEEDNKWFLNVLDSDNVSIKLSPGTDAPQHFITKNKSYSYSDRQDGFPNIYSHNVTLKEKEILNVKRITINGLAFEPYIYSEDDKDETLLTINIHCLVTEETRNHIIALVYSNMMKLEVVRDGVDRQPRIMRFGKVSWSKNDEDQKYKYGINLVDYVEKEGSWPFSDPLFVNNLGDHFIKNRLVLKKIINKLIEKGILSKADITLDLNDADEWKNFSIMHHDLDREKDIDID